MLPYPQHLVAKARIDDLVRQADRYPRRRRAIAATPRGRRRWREIFVPRQPF